MGLDKLNEFKKAAGLTNQAIADMAKLPISTVDKIMSGRTTDPKLETIKAITHVLGHTVDDLYTDELEEEKQKNSPDAEPPVSEEEKNEMAIELYGWLIKNGFVQPGEDLTDQQLAALIGILDIFDAIF